MVGLMDDWGRRRKLKSSACGELVESEMQEFESFLGVQILVCTSFLPHPSNHPAIQPSESNGYIFNSREGSMGKNTFTEKAKKIAFATASLLQRRPSMSEIKEENLARLSKSGLLDSFVTSNKGLWDNDKWLDLCDEISKQDFTPIDYDQVGLILEKKKAEYFIAHSS